MTSGGLYHREQTFGDSFLAFAPFGCCVPPLGDRRRSILLLLGESMPLGDMSPGLIMKLSLILWVRVWADILIVIFGAIVLG